MIKNIAKTKQQHLCLQIHKLSFGFVGELGEISYSHQIWKMNSKNIYPGKWYALPYITLYDIRLGQEVKIVHE